MRKIIEAQTIVKEENNETLNFNSQEKHQHKLFKRKKALYITILILKTLIFVLFITLFLSLRNKTQIRFITQKQHAITNSTFSLKIQNFQLVQISLTSGSTVTEGQLIFISNTKEKSLEPLGFIQVTDRQVGITVKAFNQSNYFIEFDPHQLLLYYEKLQQSDFRSLFYEQSVRNDQFSQMNTQEKPSELQNMLLDTVSQVTGMTRDRTKMSVISFCKQIWTGSQYQIEKNSNNTRLLQGAINSRMLRITLGSLSTKLKRFIVDPIKKLVEAISKTVKKYNNVPKLNEKQIQIINKKIPVEVKDSQSEFLSSELDAGSSSNRQNNQKSNTVSKILPYKSENEQNDDQMVKQSTRRLSKDFTLDSPKTTQEQAKNNKKVAFLTAISCTDYINVRFCPNNQKIYYPQSENLSTVRQYKTYVIGLQSLLSKVQLGLQLQNN